MPSTQRASDAPSPMVSLSARVAAAYLSSRRDVPVEQVPSLIEGIHRALRRVAAAEECGAEALVRFLDTSAGKAAMDRPALRLVASRES
ncbi:protein of unknown function (Transcriptional regulatory protein RosMucR 13-57) (plasmid) [Magnetospirillum sp. XM-1]|uniref:hypothetical protein n=1 Tax=Magnetospirillum sp. XM-1 TaxID=1663591 RepID=UPI00073DE2CB|nr:hypothetical protein [Magnetospirillum sp. XM-1]CUW41951.1 protein of unknown function (Transcriptional regulatory protein RosMucR 13-57) [Magnetospirillum sp. XM-1]